MKAIETFKREQVDKNKYINKLNELKCLSTITNETRTLISFIWFLIFTDFYPKENGKCRKTIQFLFLVAEKSKTSEQNLMSGR